MSRGGETRENRVSPKMLAPQCPGIAVQLLGAVPDGMFTVNWRGWDSSWILLVDSPGPCTAPGLEDVEQSHVTGRSSQEGWAAIFHPQTILPALVCHVHQHGAHRMQSVARSSSDQRLSAPGLCPGEWFGT